ncbi:MAG: cyclic nucleotide-binding domain-containing protein [Candidatus Hydrogenedentes bacterium]|nr:cyclic nucleotide-binding domain-containing protein [Candidatus Hydrogenedentota bacterium]
MDAKTAILDRSELFSGLDPEHIERIAECCEVCTFEAGEDIVRENEKGNSMYLIASGRVAVLKKMGEGEHVLNRLNPGEHFGEMSLVSNARRTATIRAENPVECLRLDQAGFDQLMDADSGFAQRILKVLCRRLKETDEAVTRDMLLAHQALSFSLAKLADSRDPETGGHLYRTRAYCVHLAELCRDHPMYSHAINDGFIESIYLIAPLHDIGKVAIADGILLKAGKLTDDEFQIMTTHTLRGAEALDTVLEYCDFDMFHMARRVILNHHERWDGNGYPCGVKGEDIPIEARMMMLADIYDALISKRVYKPPFSYDEAKEYIVSSSGKHFDPVMAGIMVDNIEGFQAIHKKFVESETAASAS